MVIIEKIRAIAYGAVLSQAFLGAVLLATAASRPQTAFAATIAEVNDEQCYVRISGPIARGDAKRFADLVATREASMAEASEGISSDHAICLDSHGGSVFEGRQIAQLINEIGFTTRVQSKAECYSICGLMFMAGRLLGGEADTVSRILHKEGKLGFHAPYFRFEDAEHLTGKQAAEYVQVTNLIVSDFLAFGSKRSIFDIKPMLSMSLLSDMLREPSDKVMMVDTVEKAARWSIELDGVATTRTLSRTDLIRACLNHQAWIRDEASDLQSLSYYLDEPDKLVSHGEGRSATSYLKIDTGGMEDRHCLVAIPKEPVSLIGICTYDGFSGLHVGDCSERPGYYIPQYYSLDPSTAIAKL